MKKIFKIAISAIIALALVLVPMTVMAEEGVTYNMSDSILVEGVNTYTLDSSVPYTVFILRPTAVGDFTVTSDECLLGIASYLDMWVMIEPTEETVNLNTVTWTCTDVNQAIMIAVGSDADEVTITITREDPDASQEIPWILYENTPAPEKFEMPSFVNVDAFDDGYVDFEDDVIDDAVLGDDGYYHLNDENGPVLFANLNDSIMSLYSMSGYGSISAVHYDDNGDVIKMVDYTDAFYEYVEALPTDSNGTITSYYYPLTADLIEMFKEVGTSNGWYGGDSPWIYASEDAWLYACYYDADVTTMDPAENDNTNNDNDNDNNVNDDNNGISDNNNTNNNTTGNTSDLDTNKDTSDKSPSTGDSTVALTVAILSAAALVFGVKVKR